MNKKYKSAGFSLIELMIALGIIGILGAIGYPSYQRKMLETHRKEGQIALQQMAAMQERYYTNNSQYAPTMAALNGSSTTKSGYYNISIGPGPCGNNTRCYTLTATATATGGQTKDTACLVMTLDSTDRRTPATCWP